MTVEQFVKQYAIAQGGNWTAMLLSAIKYGMPEVFNSLDKEKSFTFDEVYNLIESNLYKL